MIAAELGPHDRLVILADNDTAIAAREALTGPHRIIVIEDSVPLIVIRGNDRSA